MRCLAISLLSVAVLSCSIHGNDADDAKAVVAKAIKATGIKTTDKPIAMTWKDKGTFTGGEFKLEYSSDFTFQGPDKYRFVMNGDFNGMKITFTVVVNGDKAWESAFGQSQEMTGEKLEHILGEVYQMNVLSLAPLLSDKEYKLTLGGEKDVNGKKASVIKVARDKRPSITLYFDKESGLLVKSEMKVKDEFQQWKEVLDEGYYTDYKEVAGRQMYTKMRIVRDGKTMIESSLSDQKLHDKLDGKLFEKL
jgi:outer membrane lipoprotein-sorting protein